VKKFFNWVLVLAGIVGAFYGIGVIVPRSMTSGSKTTFVVKPDKLFAAVADVRSWPEWHPDVLSVSERPEHNKNPMWHVTEKDGVSYDMEVSVADDPTKWQGAYTIDGQRHTLRFDFQWYGEGGRAHATRTVDTNDTWLRAKAFLWSRSETDPIGLLNALAVHFGEAPKADKE